MKDEEDVGEVNSRGQAIQEEEAVSTSSSIDVVSLWISSQSCEVGTSNMASNDPHLGVHTLV